MSDSLRSDYAELLLDAVPMLDTRAPLEFAAGAFPSAINLPLMTDPERAQVGTCYKQQGQTAAIALGHRLVAGEVKAARVAAWCDFADRHPDAVLYCFRGGLRSQIVQQWMAEAGRPMPRVAGGYKAMRRFLLDALPQLLGRLQLIVIAGPAGSGKTRLLSQLPAALDLEGLAGHRGSAFGRLLDPQPAQISFENALTIDLLRLQRAGQATVFVEDESHLIGRLFLPMPLREAMQAAPLWLVEASLTARIAQIREDYVVDLGARYVARYAADGVARHFAALDESLARIARRLGGERYQRLRALLQAACAAQRVDDDPRHHDLWIAPLLSEYYDPMYRHQLQQHRHRVSTTGDFAALQQLAARL